MKGCRECCYAAPTGANLYCSINDCYVGELTCDDFEPIVKAKTNADRIRAMTDEELAEYHAEKCGCPHDPIIFGCKMATIGCIGCWLEYLKQEAKE